MKADTRTLAHGLKIIYEDRDVLVVDKPAGLLSIASSTERENTAYWILSEYLRKRGGGRQRPAVVHRLDRDTSGVMLFAKNERTKKAFMEHWKELVIERYYAALVEGRLIQYNIEDEADVSQCDISRHDISQGDTTTPETWAAIDAPLGTDRGERVVVRSDGLPALTRWRFIKYCQFPQAQPYRTAYARKATYTCIQCSLDTGRRNQIRAHMAYIGHPIAGDFKYGAQSDPLGRLALHAETLSFKHPHSRKILTFKSPVPF